MKKADLLKEALGIVEKRGLSYGKTENNFERIAQLWSIYFGLREMANREGDYHVNETDVAALMVLMKVARLMEKPDHLDSWLDIAGYAACGAEVSRAGEEPPSTVTPDPFKLDTNQPWRAQGDPGDESSYRAVPVDPPITLSEIKEPGGEKVLGELLKAAIDRDNAKAAAKAAMDAMTTGTGTVSIEHIPVNVQRQAARPIAIGDTVVSKRPYESTWVGKVDGILDEDARVLVEWRPIGNPKGKTWRTISPLANLEHAVIAP